MAEEHCMMATMAMDDDSGEDQDSVHSAFSCASDFEDDEEVEYLAMELVNHLPADQASKLLKNMRAKEKAVQDLLHRNRSLLDSCQQLDQENQALTDRLKVTAQVATATTAAAPPAEVAPTAPAANVDLSYFQKMERAKEERMLGLQHERDQLVMQCKRLDAGAHQMEDALTNARKEIKKLQQQVKAGGSGGGGSGGEAAGGVAQRPATSDLLEEEERIYKELQAGEGTGTDEVAVMMMQQREEARKQRIHDALKALIAEDLDRIQRYSSDIAALLMAVDGLEGKGKASAKAAAKKGKVAASTSSSSAAGERISELQAELVDDFDALKARTEDMEKSQLSLEQTFRGIHDGAEASAVAIALDGSLTVAEEQVDGLSQQLGQLRGISLGITAELLQHSEAALGSLLRDAPPGLLPPFAKASLEEVLQQIEGVRGHLSEQASALDEVQEGSEHRLVALKAAHQSHREEVRRRTTEELQRSARALEQPLEHMRKTLRHQSEAVGRSRGRVSVALEDMSALARRAATAPAGSSVAAGEPHAGGDAVAVGIREVRGMCKTIIVSLDESAKVLSTRMDKVFAALTGDDESSGARGRSGGGAAAPAGKAAGHEGASEAKKKKGKKKGGKADAEPRASPRTEGASAAAASAPAPAPAAAAAAEPARAQATSAKAAEEKPVHTPSSAEAEKSTRGGEQSAPTRGVLKGQELLQELQGLKAESDALEARMAERRKAKVKSQSEEAGGLPELPELEEMLAEEPASKPAPKARKKKMFV